MNNDFPPPVPERSQSDFFLDLEKFGSDQKDKRKCKYIIMLALVAIIVGLYGCNHSSSLGYSCGFAVEIFSSFALLYTAYKMWPK